MELINEACLKEYIPFFKMKFKRIPEINTFFKEQLSMIFTYFDLSLSVQKRKIGMKCILISILQG
jgi:hypothetical protein